MTPTAARPFFKTLGRAFYSPSLYREAGTQWRGTAYGFLFLAVAVLTVPLALSFQRWCARTLPQVADRLPDFQVKHGVFSSPVSQPYRADFSQGTVLIIDTTGKIDRLDQVPGIEDLTNVFLVTRTRYWQRRVSLGMARDQVRDFSAVPDFTMTRARAQAWVAAFTRWSGCLAYVLGTVLWSCLEVLALFIYALFGLWAAKLFKRALTYEGSLRLSVLSHLPAMTLTAFFPLVAQRDFPISAAVALSGAALGLAVLCQPRRAPADVQTSKGPASEEGT